jgi:hypothetical protein
MKVRVCVCVCVCVFVRSPPLYITYLSHFPQILEVAAGVVARAAFNCPLVLRLLYVSHLVSLLSLTRLSRPPSHAYLTHPHTLISPTLTRAVQVRGMPRAELEAVAAAGPMLQRSGHDAEWACTRLQALVARLAEVRASER